MTRDEETGRFVRDEEEERRARGQQQNRRSAGRRSQIRPLAYEDQGGECVHRGAAMKTTLGLLAGAGLGAAAMYLFDPYEGPSRRRYLADRASNAYESASEAAGSAWERAAAAGSSLASHLPSASDVGRQGRRMGESAQETASDWWESARAALPSRPQLRRPTDISATGATLGGLGLVALSVAATWLFDADRGRGRRAWLSQKATRYLNETGDFMRATGRHLRNKTRGYYHEGRSAVQSMTGAEQQQSASVSESCPEGMVGTPTTTPTSI